MKRNFPRNSRFLVSVILLAFVFSIFSCKKEAIIESTFKNPIEKSECVTSIAGRNGAAEIRQWLEDQKRKIGRDSNNTIDKIQASVMYDEMYIEPYRRENFIIVPLDK